MALAATYNPGVMKEIVRKTAALARLEITEEEVERLAPQFERILEAFETLTRLDVDAAEAMTRAGADEPRTRPDEERPSLAVEAILAAAPDRRDGFYSVPKTILAPPEEKAGEGQTRDEA